MVNDGGNSAKLYGVSLEGEIKEELKIDAKNHDWEDLTMDTEGNVYIADFGNNENSRTNLKVLKVAKKELSEKKAEVEEIEFSYPNQKKFPPKKTAYYFDAESLFYWKNSLYIFTKSRVKDKYGTTYLYKIPAQKGEYIAQFIGEFNAGSPKKNWITSAAISPDQQKMVLLTNESVWIFTNFKDDDFFSGKASKVSLGFVSQKESICFSDNYTLFIADERDNGNGGNLYSLKIN
jgi:hypothetical protein